MTDTRTLERRVFDGELECRTGQAQGDGWELYGHASVFSVPYSVGTFIEKFEPHAFARSLKNNPDVSLLLNHGDGGSGLPLARTKSGTLKLSEDSRGLLVEASLDPLDPDAMLLRRKLQRGDLDGQMSLSFMKVRDEYNADYSARSVIEAELNRGDVSIVTQGASPTTSAEMRELETETRSKYSESELEKLGEEGKALWLDDHWAFPTATRDDYEKALHMVALSNASPTKVRAYLIKRAKAEGWPIPQTWQRSAEISTCNRCGGEGTITITCPNCGNNSEPDGLEPITAERSLLDDLRPLSYYSDKLRQTLRTPTLYDHRARLQEMRSFSANALIPRERRGHLHPSAIHEASHAVSARLAGYFVSECRVDAHRDGGGRTEIMPPPDEGATVEGSRRLAGVSLAGKCGEEIAGRAGPCWGDVEQARRQWGGDLATLQAETTELLRAHWDEVLDIAERLTQGEPWQ